MVENTDLHDNTECDNRPNSLSLSCVQNTLKNEKPVYVFKSLMLFQSKTLSQIVVIIKYIHLIILL